MPDEANSTATSAVPRQTDRSAFKTRKALIEFLLVLTRVVMRAVKTGSRGRGLRVTEYIPRDVLRHKGSMGTRQASPREGFSRDSFLIRMAIYCCRVLKSQQPKAAAGPAAEGPGCRRLWKYARSRLSGGMRPAKRT